MVLTGVCAREVGLLSGHWHTFAIHLAALVGVSVFTFAGSYLLYWVTDRILPLRVEAAEELQGLDLSQHGEAA